MFVQLLIIHIFLAFSRSEKTQCCWHKQFEGLRAEFSESFDSPRKHYVDREGTARFIYDGLLKRYYIDANIYNSETGSFEKFYMIKFFRERVGLFVKGDRCYKQSMVDDELINNCIPSDATYEGRSHMGFGQRKLEIDTWTWQPSGTDHSVSLEVTANGCIPVTMSHRSRPRNSPYMSISKYTFLNYSPGVRDERVFDYPRVCARHLQEFQASLIG